MDRRTLIVILVIIIIIALYLVLEWFGIVDFIPGVGQDGPSAAPNLLDIFRS
ncbi:MAG: hypothetical protein ACXACG_04845 [Candidatus Thorarchaeota archaeon]